MTQNNFESNGIIVIPNTNSSRQGDVDKTNAAAHAFLNGALGIRGLDYKVSSDYREVTAERKVEDAKANGMTLIILVNKNDKIKVIDVKANKTFQAEEDSENVFEAIRERANEALQDDASDEQGDHKEESGVKNEEEPADDSLENMTTIESLATHPAVVGVEQENGRYVVSVSVEMEAARREGLDRLDNLVDEIFSNSTHSVTIGTAYEAVNTTNNELTKKYLTAERLHARVHEIIIEHGSKMIEFVWETEYLEAVNVKDFKALYDAFQKQYEDAMAVLSADEVNDDRFVDEALEAVSEDE